MGGAGGLNNGHFICDRMSASPLLWLPCSWGPWLGSRVAEEERKVAGAVGGPGVRVPDVEAHAEDLVGSQPSRCGDADPWPFGGPAPVRQCVLSTLALSLYHHILVR